MIENKYIPLNGDISFGNSVHKTLDDFYGVAAEKLPGVLVQELSDNFNFRLYKWFIAKICGKLLKYWGVLKF